MQEQEFAEGSSRIVLEREPAHPSEGKPVGALAAVPGVGSPRAAGDRGGVAGAPRGPRRRARAAGSVRALMMGRDEHERVAIAERLLVIETEARLEQIRSILEIRHAHAEAARRAGSRGTVRRIRLDLLLAATTATQADGFLRRYRSSRGAAAAMGGLRALEEQADALAAAVARL